MNKISRSVALPSDIEEQLRSHLLREDGQEDLCLAFYKMSTGFVRFSALLCEVVLPSVGDRRVHGDVTFSGDYILRSALTARERKCGLAVLHSHPSASGWQKMSSMDMEAERGFANLVREITGMPLVGMTLGGEDISWSARHWDIGVGKSVSSSECENVRVVGDRLSVTWNDEMCPVPEFSDTQIRTLSSWGEKTQADLARQKVLIVGAGSVGLDLAVRLAATGLTNISVMDYDIVEPHNLDRLIGATPKDAMLRRQKIHIAKREIAKAATALSPNIDISDYSVCEEQGFKQALDSDLIFSCVDRPWARMVLNNLAYTDLIPVIDGGISISTGKDGQMLSSTWRSHTIRHGYPCMVCLRQLQPQLAGLDRKGELDNPAYIKGAPHLDPNSNAQNVALLSVSVTSAMLLQYVGFCVSPGRPPNRPANVQSLDWFMVGGGEIYLNKKHAHHPNCIYETEISGDQRQHDWTGKHPLAETKRKTAKQPPWNTRLLRKVDDMLAKTTTKWQSTNTGRR